MRLTLNTTIRTVTLKQLTGGVAFCLLLCGLYSFSYAQKIAAGAYHSVSVCDDAAWAWGNNLTGALGDSTNVSKSVPVQVHGANNSGFLKDVTAVSAGINYSLALKKDGTVWAWGRNASGELGDSTKDDKRTPVQVHGPNNVGFLTDIVAIAAGREHALALKSDSTVWAWGMGSTGALGDNAGVWRWVPVQVHGPNNAGFLTGIIAIAAGNTHSLALKADGTVWAWGGGGNGQLGDNTFAPYKYVPVQVHNVGNTAFLTGAIAISASDNNSMALINDGSVVTWGWNLYGQLGDNTVSNRSTPVQVHGPNNSGFLTDIIAVGAAWHFSIALKNDGTVWAWGRNQYGQLGDGGVAQSNTPVQVHGANNTGFLTGITAIATGYYFSLASKNDGTLWAWGHNYYGELGNGQPNTTGCECASAPVQVNGLCTVAAVTPVADFSANQTELCESSCVNFTDNSKDADSWKWNFEGGTPASFTGKNPPQICYSASGEYTVTLVVGNAGNTDTLKRTKYIKINPTVTASVSISASDISICSGTPVTFSTTPANGGSTPSYQWKVNGNNAGTGNTYLTNTLADNDEVICVMTSSENCVTGSPASSAPIHITVYPTVTASVSISASDTSICAGTPVTFSTTPANGGSTPSYQWKVNGNNAGTGNTYSTNTLADNDEIVCVMTSNANCVTGSPASSAPISVTVSPVPVAGTVSADRDTVCEGTPAILTVTGSTANIQWQYSAYASTGFSDIPSAVNSSYTGVLSNSTYFRVYVSNGNCADTSASYPVIANPAPVAGFSYTVTGKEATFANNSTGATRYHWNFDDGSPVSAEENPVHLFPADRTYHVCLEALNGSNCSFTTCQDILIGTDAVVTLPEPDEWQIFPNPANDVIYITGKKNEDIAGVEICDMPGRIILSRHFNGVKQNNLHINISALPAGIYLLKITSKEEKNIRQVFRMIKTK